MKYVCIMGLTAQPGRLGDWKWGAGSTEMAVNLARCHNSQINDSTCLLPAAVQEIKLRYCQCQ